MKIRENVVYLLLRRTKNQNNPERIIQNVTARLFNNSRQTVASEKRALVFNIKKRCIAAKNSISLALIIDLHKPINKITLILINFPIRI